MVKNDDRSGDEPIKEIKRPNKPARTNLQCLKKRNSQNVTPENNQMELSLTNASTASCSSLALSAAAAVSLNISPGW